MVTCNKCRENKLYPESFKNSSERYLCDSCQNEITNLHQETFFFQEDKKAICQSCGGRKEYQTEKGYWRYFQINKDCFHKWLRAD